MPYTLELSWDFTPVDLFEESFVCQLEECSIAVGEGDVVAAVPMHGEDHKSALRTRVEAYVEQLFLGAQLTNHTPLTLSGPRLATVQADGRRGYVLECEPGEFRVRFGCVQMRVSESGGTFVDTKKERIDHRRRLSIAAATLAAGEEALGRMLRSYRAAVSDPQDELIHLFEIRDTLADRFGSQEEAIRKLPVSKTKWSRLGVLCNVLPLQEGRHRGRFGVEIRPATEEELAEARSLATELIQAYIHCLQRGAA